jgi:WD40 repeat protein
MRPWSHIYVASVDLKEKPKRVLPDFSPVVYSSPPAANLGYLLFLRGAVRSPGATGTLMAQPIRPDTLALLGEPVPVAEQVAIAGFSASTTGVLVYGTGGTTVPADIPGMLQGQLTWFDRRGHIVSTIGDPSVLRIPELSPDGKRVALEMIDLQSKNLDIWLFEFARGVNTRFTFHPERDVTPIWSPDGKRIAFATLETGPEGVIFYQKASNLAGDEELLFKPPMPAAPSSWSPDGRFLLYMGLRAPTDVMAVDVKAGDPKDRKPIPIVTSAFNDINARFSPDGKWISYSSNESGTYEIYVIPFNPSGAESASAGGKWMVSKGGGGQGGAVWRDDGKELFYISEQSGTLMSVEVSLNPVFAPQTPKPLFKVPAGILFCDVSSDGQRFLMPVPLGASASTPPYKIVLNWTSILKK